MRATGRTALIEEAGAPEGGGSFDGAFVGASVRELRLARQRTLQDLAGATGLSVGHLSQVERGISTPSVSALRAIAQGLGVTVGWFFRAAPEGEGGEGAYVVRAGARRRLRYASGLTDELLSPHLGGALELLLSRFAPGAESGAQPYAHRGEEAGLVIEGRLEIWIEGERFELGAGDSFAFPSARAHRYRNPADRETVVVWAITPPTF